MIRYIRMRLLPDPAMSEPDYPVYVPEYNSILFDVTKCSCSIPAVEIPARGMLQQIPWVTLKMNDDCAACAEKIRDLLSRLDVSETKL